MKQVLTFPQIAPDALFELMKKRPDWDDGIKDFKVLETNDTEGWKIIRRLGNKPPIPGISAREFVMKNYTKKDGAGEGKHVLIGQSVEHKDAPIKTGWTSSTVRATQSFIRTIIEADAEGSKMTVITRLDMNGLKEMIMDKLPEKVPLKLFEALKKQI